MLDNLPEWAPPILVKLYRDETSSKPKKLLERFVYDPRMEMVWRSIISRHADPLYPWSIYIAIAFVLLLPEPKLSPKISREKYLRISDSCRDLISDMEDSIFTDEVISSLKLAEITANNMVVHFTYSPYKQKITRFDLANNPKQTVLIRTIYELFLRDIKQPLWGTIADLASVALNLHGYSVITEDKVRGCCLKYTPPPRSKLSDNDCGMPVEIEPIPHGE